MRHVHQRRGSTRIADLEGVDLPDSAAAREEAIAAARELMSDALRSTGRLDVGWQFEIADDRGNIVDRIAFAEAVGLRQ
jgi:hypothetical protein